jgi:argininosuccinate lyase
MPQKKNPDVLEVIRSKAALMMGNLVTILSTVKSLPSGYNRDLQDLKPTLWKMSTAALESLKMMTGLVKALYIHKERMQVAANNSYAVSVDIAEQLVVKKGIPFRSAHKVIGALVEKAVSKNNVALTMLQEEDIDDVLKKIKSNLQSGELIQLIREVTPNKSLELRISSGSPNPKEQYNMISFSYRRLAGYREGVSKRMRCIAAAFDNLAKTTENYMNA